nr:F-box protein At5g03100-like isoform X1 [Ipomoea trifida]
MLVLRTKNLWFSSRYYVPQHVFIAQTLEVLDLSFCTFDTYRIVHVDLPHLETLSLSRCWILGDKLLQKIVCGNNLLEKVLSACGPSMKHISISWCKGIGSVSLSDSCKPLLKGFFLRCDDEFKRIKIDAPNLRTFSYESTNAACVIDLTSCTNLENLYGGIGKSLNHPASALLLHHKI